MMMRRIVYSLCLLIAALTANARFQNPMLFSDVPDQDIIRVGDTYYMVSTTMHFAPGCGIMKSKDLVNWEIVNYAYDELDVGDNFRLLNGKSEYSQGSWAANLRYDPYEKMFYMIMTCNTTGKTYFYVTDDIENGRWHVSQTDKCYDPGLLFDDNGKEVKKYVLHPADTFDDHAMYLREMHVDDQWNVTVSERRMVLPYAQLENPARGLRAEGYHGYKIGDYYYIFMIQGCDGQRQEIVWRTRDLFSGKWESRLVFGGEMVDADGKVVMKNNGIGQGGVVQAKDGRWWCTLFKDYGSLGRMPVWLPMTWSKDGWPLVGTGKTTSELPEGKNMTTPLVVDLPAQKSIGIVQNDEFDTWKPKKSQSRFGWRWENSILGNQQQGRLKPVWQWNHIPDPNGWSLTERKGWLRLKTTAVVRNIREARNTLTQRTFGPVCQGEVLLDASQLKEGDYAGLSCYQNRYAFIGVTKLNGELIVVMQKALEKNDAMGRLVELAELSGTTRVWLRVNCDFRDMTDKMNFHYSIDGKNWQQLGDTPRMHYDWPDFCGYRFALFHFATEEAGGIADFDFFHVR
jgi:arabinoxylan arabinofuranohydrolase